MECGLKICVCCKITKKLDNFNKNSSSLDGYHKWCKCCRSSKLKQYREHIKSYKRKYRKQNPHFSAIRNMIHRYLRTTGRRKCNKTETILGYGPVEFKKHIESMFSKGMSWGNYGEWHEDHKKPISSFVKNENPAVVNSLSNLQPLWAVNKIVDGVLLVGNLNKKDKYD